MPAQYLAKNTADSAVLRLEDDSIGRAMPARGRRPAARPAGRGFARGHRAQQYRGLRRRNMARRSLRSRRPAASRLIGVTVFNPDQAMEQECSAMKANGLPLLKRRRNRAVLRNPVLALAALRQRQTAIRARHRRWRRAGGGPGRPVYCRASQDDHPAAVVRHRTGDGDRSDPILPASGAQLPLSRGPLRHEPRRCLRRRPRQRGRLPGDGGRAYRRRDIRPPGRSLHRSLRRLLRRRTLPSLCRTARSSTSTPII